MPTHRNNWRVTVALFAVTGIIESLAFGHLSAFTPLYLQQLQVPAGEIPRWTGVLASLGFILGIPLLPFWGVWADRYSRKLIIVRSSVAGALMFALMAWSSNVWQLAAARLLVGFVLGNTGVMLAVQAEITPRNRIGTAIAIVAAGPALGMALGPVFGGLIVQRYSIPTLLLIDAALTLGVALMLIVGLHEEPRERRTDVAMTALLRASLHNIVQTPLILRLFGLAFLVLLGVSAAGPFVPIRTEQLFTGPANQLPVVIGWLVSGAGMAMALSTPLWGRLSDRVGYVRVLRIGVGSVGVMMFVQAIAWSLPLFFAARIGQGLVQGGIDAAFAALIALRAPNERRASILNFSRLPAQLSWFLGPILGSLLSPFGMPVIFGVSALCVMLGFIAALLLERSIPNALTTSETV